MVVQGVIHIYFPFFSRAVTHNSFPLLKVFIHLSAQLNTDAAWQSWKACVYADKTKQPWGVFPDKNTMYLSIYLDACMLTERLLASTHKEKNVIKITFWQIFPTESQKVRGSSWTPEAMLLTIISYNIVFFNYTAVLVLVHQKV